MSVPDKVYYVRIQPNLGHGLIDDTEDAEKLSHYASKAVDISKVLIHAFSWRRARADLLIQVGHFPLGYAVQLISGPFAQYLRAKRAFSAPFFRRYRAALVGSELQFLQIVHYIHKLPVRDQLAGTPDEYAHHSHHDYASAQRMTPWLKTDYVRNLLAQRVGSGRESYARWMAEPIHGGLTRLLEHTDGRLPIYTERAVSARRL